MKAVLLLALLSRFLSAQQEPQLLFERAIAAQQKGDFASAARAYQELLRSQPGNVGALSNFGVVLTNLGRFDEAIAQYESAAKLAPSDPRIGLNLALAYLKSGRVTEAASRLDALHGATPGDQQVTLLLADCNLQLGDNGRVISLLSASEDKDPAVAYLLGTALVRAKRVEEGQVLLERILRNGDSAEARFLLGTQMFSAGDYPAAVKQLGFTIALNSSLPELQAYYGRALLLTGDPGAATEAFRKELTANPNNYLANLSLGQVLTERRDFGAARPLLERALLVRPRSSEAMQSLGRAQLGLGNWLAARKHLEAALLAGDNSTELHLDLATVYAHSNESLKARQQRGEVAKKDATTQGGPSVGDLAPPFNLPSVMGDKPVALSDFRGKTPVVLIFGSYSCPNFRSASEALQALESKYGRKAPFLLVYIKEAHTKHSWESSRNATEDLNLASASNMQEKQDHALMCSRKLHLRFPAIVDGMDGAVEGAYAAWPTRVVLVGRDGRILYSTRLTELDFHSSEMETALRRTLIQRPH